MSADKKIPKFNGPELFDETHNESESWYAFEIMSEFVGATEKLKKITPAVSVFGSARVSEDHPYYKLTVDMQRRYPTPDLVLFLAAVPVLWKP